MLVKCRICGNKIDKNEAFKIVVNGKNHYYCSKKEYDEWFKNQREKDNTYNLIYDIFGRKITNTVIYKEIGGLADIYTYEEIYKYLVENKDYLQNVMQKEFSSEYAQIRYFSAILKNGMTDFIHNEKLEESVKKNIQVDMSEYKFKRKKHKKTLSEYEEEIGGETWENL